MTENNTTALDEVLAWLDSLEPTQRARFLTVLLDTRNHRTLSQRRVAAVYAATRTSSQADVAKKVGVSPSAINHAVGRHKAVLAAQQR